MAAIPSRADLKPRKTDPERVAYAAPPSPGADYCLAVCLVRARLLPRSAKAAPVSNSGQCPALLL